MSKPSKPIYDVPRGFEGQIRVEAVQSVRGCPDCADCLDVYPMTNGQDFLLVNGQSEPMIVSRGDLEGLQKLNLNS
jgi:hypothetical protein